MPKFSAKTVRDLMTAERSVGRATRGVKVVVCVEADDGSWFEMDATDTGHATLLATNMADPRRGGARGCSCWKVNSSGTLAKRSFFNVYATAFEPVDCGE